MYIELLTDMAIERLPMENRPVNLRNEIKKFYTESIGQVIEDHVNKSLSDLEIQYDKAINELSTVDPIGAFWLFGKNKFFSQSDDAFEIFSNNLIQKIQYVDNENLIEDSFDVVKSFFKPDMINNLIFDIEAEIIRLASSINFSTWRDVKRALKKSKPEITNEQKENIKILFEKLEQLALANQSK